jgi:hypothetical protein
LETTTVRHLADGNIIEQTYRSKHARDSLGRTRLETPNTVVIGDPAARTIVFLDVRNHLARRARVAERPEGRVAPRRGPGSAGEDLGKATVAGFEVEGRRLVATIPANTIGNRDAIQQIQEMWYSPELEFALIRKSSDSISGDTTQRAISVRKSPYFPPNYFAVPGDYRLVEIEGSSNGGVTLAPGN